MDKQTLRKAMKEKLAALSPAEKERKSAAVCEALKEVCGNLPGLTLLSYMPTENEADVTAFNGYFRELGNAVAYPVCGDAGSMEFYIPDDGAGFVPDRYGILEPDTERSVHVDPGQADMILVPCVAFSRELARLGHGGGYYDRYLARCGAALKILVAFSEQEADCIETEETDAAVDIAVTDSEVLGAF